MDDYEKEVARLNGLEIDRLRKRVKDLEAQVKYIGDQRVKNADAYTETWHRANAVEKERDQLKAMIKGLCEAFSANEAEIEAAKVARIQQARFERGQVDAKTGEPPTEASPEYQKGYKSFDMNRFPGEG